MTVPAVLDLAIWTLAGGGLGAVYLFLLRRTITALTTGVGGLGIAMPVLARLALAGAGFWLAATQGAAPLLCMLTGFTVVRIAVLRRTRGD